MTDPCYSAIAELVRDFGGEGSMFRRPVLAARLGELVAMARRHRKDGGALYFDLAESDLLEEACRYVAGQYNGRPDVAAERAKFQELAVRIKNATTACRVMTSRPDEVVISEWTTGPSSIGTPADRELADAALLLNSYKIPLVANGKHLTLAERIAMLRGTPTVAISSPLPGGEFTVGRVGQSTMIEVDGKRYTAEPGASLEVQVKPGQHVRLIGGGGGGGGGASGQTVVTGQGGPTPYDLAATAAPNAPTPVVVKATISGDGSVTEDTRRLPSDAYMRPFFTGRNIGGCPAPGARVKFTAVAKSKMPNAPLDGVWHVGHVQFDLQAQSAIAHLGSPNGTAHADVRNLLPESFEERPGASVTEAFGDIDWWNIGARPQMFADLLRAPGVQRMLEQATLEDAIKALAVCRDLTKDLPAAPERSPRDLRDLTPREVVERGISALRQVGCGLTPGDAAMVANELEAIDWPEDD